MSKNPKNFRLDSLIYGAVLIPLITTPFVNKDALIVPKVIILFLLALFLVPNVFANLSELKSSRLTSIFTIISAVIIVQIIVVSFFSDAPVEQSLFGRTGRGLGLITMSSLLVLSLVSVIYSKLINAQSINRGLTICGICIASYAILQYFGKDPFGWDSKTNGIISTLGNPNFVSSFIAMAFIPALVYVTTKSRKLIYQGLLTLLFVYVIYIAESTQGYVNLLIAIFTFLLIYYFYQNRVIFYAAFSLFILAILFAILGALNNGPLAGYLYKVSVQSRGDFWRAALNSIDSNKIFGVGLDSFGDYYLRYRDQIALSHPWAEYTDSAHNYFLDYAVSGGIILSFLHLTLLFLIIFTIFRLRKLNPKFDSRIAGLISALSVYFAQSLISPMNISLLLWGYIILGFLIGLNKPSFNDSSQPYRHKVVNNNFFLTGVVFVLSLTFIAYPYFNSDRIQLLAMKTGNGDLAIKSAKMFPESTVRYYVLTRELFDAGLQNQSLELAYSAVAFNSNSAALWSLILINPSAPLSDRIKAKTEILKLDPLNKDIPNYVLTPN